MPKIRIFFKNAVFVLLLGFLGVILFAGIRGLYGNPNEKDLNNLSWRDNGPFELSPERGRFALLYSVVENGSFYFSVPIARFVVPDLGYKNGHYVSLFAPAVSYAAIPGYVVGKYFGISQVGAFATSSFFGFVNLILIYLIMTKLKVDRVTAVLSGIIFLFATPAFAYAANFYQHHLSTFLILFSIYLLLKFNNFWSLAGIWFLCAMSIPVDYPNLFLMMPIGIHAFFRFFDFKSTNKIVKLSFDFIKVLSIAAVLLPLGFFLWFNQHSYGNPFQFSGTVGSARAIDENGLPTAATKVSPEDIEWYKNPDNQQKSAVNFFKSRNMLNGLYIHILSPDRGIITFTPVILLGIFGIVVLYKNKNKYLAMLLGVVGANLFLYSMWGDPWGGWAFGSRYMIPSYAIMSIFLGVALYKFNRKWFFIIPFWILLIYSIGVNTLGALTTSTNPPKAESLALEQISGRRERYSYDRNWEFLNNQGTKSFVYSIAGYKYMTPVQYYYLITGSIAFLATILTLAVVLNKNENE